MIDLEVINLMNKPWYAEHNTVEAICMNFKQVTVAWMYTFVVIEIISDMERVQISRMLN